MGNPSTTKTHTWSLKSSTCLRSPNTFKALPCVRKRETASVVLSDLLVSQPPPKVVLIGTLETCRSLTDMRDSSTVSTCQTWRNPSTTKTHTWSLKSSTCLRSPNTFSGERRDNKEDKLSAWRPLLLATP